MMNKAYFYLLLLVIQDSAGIKMFEFEKTPGITPVGFSAATLESQITPQLPNEFVLCSSHFQREVNTKSTRTIYVIYEDEEFVTPWFNIGIWSENYLWANIEHNYWYAIGQVSDEDYAGWIHICLKIDINKLEIETSINGKSFNKTQVRKFQVVPKFNLKIGVVHHSEKAVQSQFFGRVSNIQLLRYEEETLLHDLTKNLCNEREEQSILLWSDFKWNLSGENVKALDTDSSYVCSNSSFFDLYVPFSITRGRAKDICSKLGNGEISSVQNPFYIEECEDLWTPYLYSQMKGKTINEYSHENVSINWCDGMPLNRTNFDQVTFDNLKDCYENTNRVALYEYCTICNSSFKTIYTMRGNCKSSILGLHLETMKTSNFKNIDCLSFCAGNYNYHAYNSPGSYYGFYGSGINIV